jgi:hypothetical protein
LLNLGQQRGAAVKQYLIDKYGIDSSRLLICNTMIETEKDSQPAVLLQR